MLRDGNNGRTVATVASCQSCLAWGLTYSQGVCLACYGFAAYFKTAGTCGACGRHELLKKGYCRLCWCQAYRERTTGPGTPLAPWVALVRHHQLFFASMSLGVSRRHAPPRAFPRRVGAKGRPFKDPPPPAGRPRVDGIQLRLFDPGPRRYDFGGVDLRNGPPPDNQWLAWALHLAHQMGESHGFSPIVRGTLQRSLVMLLADYPTGELVRYSDYEPVLRKRGASLAQTTEILSEMGILEDDRPPVFDAWLEDKLGELAAGIAVETCRWANALKDGGPRSRSRLPDTVRSHLRRVRPSLLAWSERYDHLREVTREDVFAVAAPLTDPERADTLAGLRSLFRWAKKNGVVFADPTARLRIGRTPEAIWQPLRDEEIAQTMEAASSPQARVFVALAAVHAARPGAIREMTLDDVDLANRRVTIAGRTRPLDDFTHRVLAEWLDHRRQRWPHTANRHLLISRVSALKVGPVSAPWVGRIVQGLPATIERLRIDRQLDEAIASGADPLHVALVFGMSDSAAVRYAENARQLLERPHETHAASSSLPTEVSLGRSERPDHLGSR
ncbi:MAG: tyrosine-type recombinase/integrase [Acidimicrobiales bacterium]